MSKSVQHLAEININDMWETPDLELKKAMMKYDVHPFLDVCSTKNNAKFSEFFTESDDGLSKEWTKDFFMNPPYSQITQWMKKAYDQHIKHNVTGLILVYAKCGVKWFEDYVYDYFNDKWLTEFKPINHRIQFEINGIIPKYCDTCKKKFYDAPDVCPICGNTKLTKNSAPYDSCWIIFRKTDEICRSCDKNPLFDNQITCDECHSSCKPEDF